MTPPPPPAPCDLCSRAAVYNGVRRHVRVEATMRRAPFRAPFKSELAETERIPSTISNAIEARGWLYVPGIPFSSSSQYFGAFHAKPLDHTHFQKVLLELPTSMWQQDLRRLHNQLRRAQACGRRPYRATSLQCYGLGTSLTLLAEDYAINTIFSDHRFVVHNDDGRCGWFRADRTKTCNSLLGCYLPSLGETEIESKKARAQQQVRLALGLLGSTNRAAATTGSSSSACTGRNSSWFSSRWGPLLQYVATLGHLLRSLWAPNPATEDCIAVHVRRGDACLNPDRHCHSFERYLAAARAIRKATGIARLYILTDANDLPLDKWRRHFESVDVQERINRTLAQPPRPRDPHSGKLLPWTTSLHLPEVRVERGELGAAPVAELLEDVRRAGQCKALVGTFTASVSKLVFALQLLSHSAVPPFLSLDGCVHQVPTGEFRCPREGDFEVG